MGFIQSIFKIIYAFVIHKKVLLLLQIFERRNGKSSDFILVLNIEKVILRLKDNLFYLIEYFKQQSHFSRETPLVNLFYTISEKSWL